MRATAIDKLIIESNHIAEAAPDLSPERKLCAAIIQRCIWDLKNPSMQADSIDKKSARAFLRNRSTCPWSVKWICEHLDLDLGKLRQYALS